MANEVIRMRDMHFDPELFREIKNYSDIFA